MVQCELILYPGDANSDWVKARLSILWAGRVFPTILSMTYTQNLTCNIQHNIWHIIETGILAEY